MAIDRFMTAQEIADAAARLSLTCMPHSKRSVNRRASQEGWDALAQFVRIRNGSTGGGGKEYHVSLLPQPMQDALAGEISRDVVVASEHALQVVETTKRTALETTDLTARQREVMDARAAILNAIDETRITTGLTRNKAVGHFLACPTDCGVSVETLSKANDRRNGSGSISRATVLRWFKFRDESGIAALAPKATKAKDEIPEWFWRFLKHYARPQKPCFTEAFGDYRQEPGADLEAASVEKARYIYNTKLGNVEKHRGREGYHTLKARMAFVRRTTSDLIPACVYTADGKTFDGEVAHPLHGKPFRPEITSVVDVATRKCVGWSIGLAENAEGVVDALRAACEAHGVPAIFYVDRGPGFKNNRMDDRLVGLMGRLGIHKPHSIPGNSQARGLIERFHGTVWNPLAREYDTYVNVRMDRQAGHKSFKVTRKQIREFGTSEALPTWEHFVTDCARAISVYNAKPHSSLPDRMSPDEYWQHHVERGFEPVTMTQAEINDVFRPYVRRKVVRAEIEFATNRYFNIALEEYHGDYVLVGYDIHNAAQIWVRAIDTVDGEERPGRLICIAQFGGNEARYVPVTMERLAKEKRANARKRRLQEKMDEVEEELNPTALLNHQPDIPMPDLTAQPQAEVIDGTFTDMTDAPQISTEGGAIRPLRFGSDAELAQWALANQEAVQAGQIDTLRACLMDPFDKQLLEDHGVDIEALTELVLRAA